MKCVCSLALSKVIFINLYWKDDRSGTGKAGGFFKRKSSSLYNQAVKVICQEVAMTLISIGSYYLNCTSQ